MSEHKIIIGIPKEERCDHSLVFDEVAARHMSVSDIRKHYPRLSGACPKGCGYCGIAYASYKHYTYGDW